MTRKKIKPPPIGTVVAVRWVDSGCSHHQVRIFPSDASISTARTVGEMVGWVDDSPCPEKNICVLRTSEWFLANGKTPSLDDDKDLFSIWIPSILEITEYKKVKK